MLFKNDRKVEGVVTEREKDVDTGARGRGGIKDGLTHKMEVWRDSWSEGGERDVCA